jgi:isopenicillin N synthase-like dioxygenase
VNKKLCNKFIHQLFYPLSTDSSYFDEITSKEIDNETGIKLCLYKKNENKTITCEIHTDYGLITLSPLFVEGFYIFSNN